MEVAAPTAKAKQTTPTAAAAGGKQTPIDERSRQTGQGSSTTINPGAEADTAGGNPQVAGDPNQGTEAR